MKILKKIKLFLFLIILVLSFFKIQNFCSNVLISDVYSLSYDPILSKELSKSILQYTNKNLKNSLPDDLFKKLKNEFPVIENISVWRSNPNLLNVKIEADIPEYKINNNLILTKQFKLLPIDCFTQNAVDSLESILIDFNKSNVDLEFMEFISNFPKNLLLDFEINYNSKNDIFITSKSDKQFLVLTRYNKVLSNKILEQCKTIKYEKNIGYNKKFVADLRFGEQIKVSIM